MAEDKPARKRRKPDENGESEPRRGRSSGGDRLSGAKLARHARDELAEITGLEAESVTALSRSDDGTWKVVVELLELQRIPETDDVLGSYEAELDENGELLGYRRLRRYARSQAGEEQWAAGK